MTRLTQHANDLIENNYPDWINILEVYEDCGHDGRDEDGPQSYIWDLYIYYETNNGNRVVDNWHWENWFNGREVGYIGENDVQIYSHEQFFAHHYFGRYIAHHLFRANPQDDF